MKKLPFFFNIIFIYLISQSACFADLKKKLINQITSTQTLSFDFVQQIADNKEEGICLIKYPLLMRCDYQDLKGKTVISNGKTVAVIKKKYKKIYFYPIKTTPLFILLKKEKILNLIREVEPVMLGSNFVEFTLNDKKINELKVIFDKDTLKIKGWKTKDMYSNNVIFTINNLEINNKLSDDLFKIPKEKDL
tara:strand:+ start:17 stop:592 length:576 start_codon:yes stop_codon:yes gene_type:complete